MFLTLTTLIVTLIIHKWKNSFLVHYRGPESDHFNGKTFYNPGRDRQRGLLALIRWKMSSSSTPWPKKIENIQFHLPPPIIRGDNIEISMIGHASVLIQTQRMNIITDPIYSDRASPFSNFGPKRIIKPGIEFDKLPKINVVLLTHNHYDHMDIETLKRIVRLHNPIIITPLGNNVILRKAGLPKAIIYTFDWHQGYRLNNSLKITLCPAIHWSSRYMVDKNRALWGGFIIQTSKKYIYFAGDTGYGDGSIFREIKSTYGVPALALLPIGAYEPRWFMKPVHLSPKDAVRTFRDLGKPNVIGMHHGVFKLTDEGYEQPIIDLAKALKGYKLSDRKKFIILNPGQVAKFRK